MKKIACLAFALLLCLTTTVFAESAPSRTVCDMTDTEVSTENACDDSGFYIWIILERDRFHQMHIDACDIEIAKLAASPDVETYFGAMKDNKGKPVYPKEVLDTDTLYVYEFWPVIAGGYKESYGDVTARFELPTPYAKDEKVIVMIGLVTVGENWAEDHKQSVEWTAYEGVGLGLQTDSEENMGAVQVKFDPEIVMGIQEGIALFAVVSQEGQYSLVL